ncbi:MAG: polysaccharide deacetylase family protein [Desertifilum sp.]|nr:polysaccharide deacetylase family protein [Desertifilum sp.]
MFLIGLGLLASLCLHLPQLSYALPPSTIPARSQGIMMSQVKLPLPERAIALTFDDGPSPDATPEILATLERYQVKATFFVIGRHVQRYPEISQQLVAQGHAIGNHTWSHRSDRLNPQEAGYEINQASRIITQVTGVRTLLFRPPKGRLENGLVSWAQKNRYLVALWSVDSRDYQEPTPHQIVQTILRQIQPGGIILMHDGNRGRMQAAAALPELLEALKAEGYEFVTLPELLQRSGQF